jgi:hypothetical protein
MRVTRPTGRKRPWQGEGERWTRLLKAWGGSHRGISGLWAALVLVGLAVWSMQTGSVEAQCPPVGGGSSTVTTSTTSHSTHTRVDSFSTRITGRLAMGTIVYDQTFPLPFSDPAVQQAVLDAKAALVAAAAPQVITIVGPTLLSSTVMKTGEQVTGAQQSVTTTTTFGPATILIGEDQSQTFFVAAGTMNINTNTHTETFVNDLFLTTQAYGLLAVDARAIPTLSEWAQLGMAALLVLGGLAALRRRSGQALALRRPRRIPPE